MKCYCVKEDISIDSLEAAWSKGSKVQMIDEGEVAYFVIGRGRTYDCNDCCHRLACLLDPKCRRKFESR